MRQSCGQSESDNFDGFLRQPCLEFIARTGTNGMVHCSCSILVLTIDLSCDRSRSPRQGLFHVFALRLPFHCPGNGPCLSWRPGAVVQQIVHLLQQGARNPVELLREGDSEEIVRSEWENRLLSSNRRTTLVLLSGVNSPHCLTAQF